MTTGPLSSPAGSAKHPTAYLDSSGQQVKLGAQLGSGGEGAVFAVEGNPALAAKIYHRTPLAADHLEKLEAMISRQTDALAVVSAWPKSILYNARREACGILLTKIVDALQLHELYGTSNRRAQFPYVKWHHMVLAARNVAAAFECMHKSGIVVGDVNQGNLLVDREMCVRFIDCDSFQVEDNGKVYNCPVGTPHFTPPELQSQKLRDKPRTPEQDRFGMAVLIFHLLFVGRHPFAGRFYGDGELTIERAIAERRFAFSKDRAVTQVEPPPASLQMSDVSPTVAALFEAAFRGEAADRPKARLWVEALEGVIAQRKACPMDQAHISFGPGKECPWCRIEDEGGPAFFVLGGSTSMVMPDRLEHLENKLKKLMLPVFPDLSPQSLRIPQAIAPKRLSTAPKMAGPDVEAWVVAAGAAACLAAPLSGWAYIAGAAATALGAGAMIFTPAGKERRRRAHELNANLEALQLQLYQRGQAVEKHHRLRHDAFENSVDQLKIEYDNFRNATKTQLHDVLAIYRSMQKSRYLSSHLIQKNIRNIRGMGPSLASALASYGIESAYDVEPLRLLGLPMINADRLLELKTWRAEVERQFVFTPEHGISLDSKTVANEATIKRFKASVARRILMAARQLESVVSAGREQLSQDLKTFEKHAERVRTAAAELRDFQSNRRPLERLLNRTPAVILGVAATALALGALFYWMNH